MPMQSQSQRRLFWWAKANPKAAKREKGIKPGVAKEFTSADKGGKLPERVEPKTKGEKWYGAART